MQSLRKTDGTDNSSSKRRLMRLFDKQLADEMTGFLSLSDKDCGFITPIHLMRLPDKQGEFVVTQNLVYLSKEVNMGIVVRPGYITNGASTPRIVWSFIDPFSGKYLAPAILHDSLYEAQIFSRERADAVFREAMLSCGVGKIQTEAMYRSVRWFGQSFWEAAKVDPTSYTLTACVDAMPYGYVMEAYQKNDKNGLNV